MTSIANIEPLKNSAAADPGNTLKYSFSVVNSTDQGLTLGAKVLTDDSANSKWFSVSEPAERKVGAGELDQIDVTANIPADAEPGDYRFRLLVYSAQTPGEDFTEGPEVILTVNAPSADHTPDENTSAGFNWKLWGAIAAMVILVLGGGGFFAYQLCCSSEKVPDLAGMTVDEAAHALAEVHMTLDEDDLTELWTGNFDQGTINDQTPAAGEKAPESVVGVTLEQFRVMMPTIIGLTTTAAENELLALGLSLSPDIKHEASDRYAGGAVIKQDPAADQPVVPNTEVVITVAKKIVNTPDLTGKSFASATVILNASELAVGDVTHQQTGGNPDTIIRQDPLPNTQTDAESAVDLWIVEKKIPVPNVVNQKLTNATEILSDAGFTVQKESILVARDITIDKRLIVIQQVPKHGTKAFSGSEVWLRYYPGRRINRTFDTEIRVDRTAIERMRNFRPVIID